MSAPRHPHAEPNAEDASFFPVVDDDSDTN